MFSYRLPPARIVFGAGAVVLPAIVLYDPDLTLSLPSEVSAAASACRTPTHGVLLPYVTAFNASATGGAMQVVRHAFGADEEAAGALHAFNRRLGVQRSLRDLGLQPRDLEKADLAVATSYPNPRPVARADALEILRAAFEGGPPPRSA